MYPKQAKYVENFMRMMLATPSDDDVALIRYCTRIRQNFNSSRRSWTKRSTSPPVWPCPVALTPTPALPPGIACLWGAAHGGANEAVLNMLIAIGDVSRIPAYVAKAKDKNDPSDWWLSVTAFIKSWSTRHIECVHLPWSPTRTGTTWWKLFKLPLTLERRIALRWLLHREKALPNVDFIQVLSCMLWDIHQLVYDMFAMGEQ